MRNLTGGVARGGDFFGRETELAELVHLFERDHVLLLAPRRVGKTSLMYRLKDAPPPGWNVAYTDVESATSEAAFVARLLFAVAEAAPADTRRTLFDAKLKSLFDRVGKVGAGPLEVELATTIGTDWQDVGLTLARSLSALADPTVVLVDEFPILVHRLLAGGSHGRARAFLDWFRALRLAGGVQANVRFVLAGSMALDGVLARARMSATINDLATFRLGPLAPDRAQAMLAALAQAEGLPLTGPVFDRLLERVVWPVPFHLQLLFSELLRAHRFRRQELTVDLVDACYTALLAPDKRKHFAHWVERLEFEDPAEQALARAVLAAAARDPRGVGRDTLAQLRRDAPSSEKPDLSALLSDLDHDGYLVEEAGRWRFASPLVRDWWLKWEVR